MPPPTPSTSASALSLKGNVRSLQDADQLLTRSLTKANYSELAYYEIDGGFALVTPLEQLKEDATPKGDPPRWDVKVDLRQDFSFLNYFKALFFGEKGYYRILVFIITDKPIRFNAPSSGTTIQDLAGGLDRLPAELASLPYTKDHRCTVLVYEFAKAKGEAAKFIKPCRYGVKTHLQRTLIWGELFY